jgi:hypothetical protein
MVYTIQTGIYHGIYYLSGAWTYCCLMAMVYTRFLVYTVVYTVVRVLYTMAYTSLTNFYDLLNRIRCSDH